MWFATHWVFLVRFSDGSQETYPILERVVLLEAFDEEEAKNKAALMVKNEQELDPGTYYWHNRRPSILEFLGVNRTVVLSSKDGGSSVTLNEGRDLTYWEYTLSDPGDLKRLLEKNSVNVNLLAD